VIEVIANRRRVLADSRTQNRGQREVLRTLLMGLVVLVQVLFAQPSESADPAAGRVIPENQSRDGKLTRIGPSTASEEHSTKRPISIDDLLRMENIRRAIVTPDGEAVIYEKIPPYETAMTSGAHSGDVQDSPVGLMYLDLQHHATPQPLFAQDPKGAYWLEGLSPDGQTLAVNMLVDGKLRAGAVSLQSHKITVFAFEPAVPSLQPNPTWISSDELVYVTAPSRWDESSLKGRAGLIEAIESLYTDALSGVRPSSTVVRSSKDGLHEVATFLPGELLRVNVHTGLTKRIGDGQFYDITLSPNKRYLAALKNAGRYQPSRLPPGVEQIHREALVVFDLASESVPETPCSECDIFVHTLAWSHDGDRLTYIAKAVSSGETPAMLWEHRPGSTLDHPYNLQNFQFACGTSEARANVPVPAFTDEILAYGHPSLNAESPMLTPIQCADPAFPISSKRDVLYRLRRDRAPEPLVEAYAADSQLVTADDSVAYFVASGSLWMIQRSGHTTNCLAAPHRGYGAYDSWRSVIKPQNYLLQSPGMISDDRIVLESDREIVLFKKGTHAHVTIKRPSSDAQLLDVSSNENSALFITRTAYDGGAPAVGKLVVAEPARAPLVISSINSYLQDIANPVESVVEYDGPHGERLSSCLLLPSGSKDHAQRYPTIVVVYPGYKRGECSHFLGSWSYDLFTSEGYAVLFPATPSILMASDAGPTGNITDLVVRSVEAAVGSGKVDPNAVGLFGHSQGMHEVLRIITETDRFKAAFVWNGISDFASEYGSFSLPDRFSESSWLGTSESRFEFPPYAGPNSLGVKPWENPARYMSNSPVFSADKIHTPLLLVNGDLDVFGLNQSAEMFNALYRLRREAEYVTYWGEGHVNQSPANIRDLWARQRIWFNTHLRETY
jgi:Prolyl oligopeptidase family